VLFRNNGAECAVVREMNQCERGGYGEFQIPCVAPLFLAFNLLKPGGKCT
jgi:hypothetical protein